MATRYFGSGYNCAQAVLKASGKASDELINEASRYGGGQGLNGYCGALYGALLVLDKTNWEEFINKFKTEVGFTACRDIRRENKVSCTQCVQIASSLLDKENNK